MKIVDLIRTFFDKSPESSLEFWSVFFLRHYRRIVFAGGVIMLGLTILFGWLSTKKVKEVVTDEFNQQQLVLARHAADQISYHLQMLVREITILSLSPSVQYFERSSLAHRMGISFASLREEAVVEIRYIETGAGRVHLVNNLWYGSTAARDDDFHYLDWGRDPVNRGSVRVSDVFVSRLGGEKEDLLVTIAAPVWQVSVDDAHPISSNKFSGVLVIVVDVTKFVGRLVENIKSGKTGYAWVIDSSGTFLFHKERSFIGKNAFEARKEKRPTISFDRINEIQMEMMLTGKEGMSWYISGWHRGQEGEMRKLIAYAPIRLKNTDARGVWSVAVVAPSSEVESAIHDIQVRQFSLQALIVILILMGSLTAVFLEARWSIFLKREVTRQTTEFVKSEQRYKSLVEGAEDIIFTVDQNGNYLSINDYGARFLHRSSGDIVGQNMLEILSCPEELLATVKEVFHMKKRRQITHRLKVEEREYWLNTNLRRLFDEEGNIYAVLGISRDITDRKKMEEQSYHTEKLASMGTLAAGVAHEINNPLAIILGFADLLKEKTAEGSDSYEMLSTIERQGLKARKVVENLLTLARLKEHKEDEVDINKNILGVLAVIGNNLLLNKIAFDKLELSDSLPRVKGDPDELQQVFLNIISNAVQEMRGGGVLTIVTRAVNNGENVEIRIADTGRGIDKEHRTRIFDPLFTTKKVGEGTGLGLSVSYGIITRHGGTITFETKTKEESSKTGTAFVITLPAITAEVRAAVP